MSVMQILGDSKVAGKHFESSACETGQNFPVSPHRFCMTFIGFQRLPSSRETSLVVSKPCRPVPRVSLIHPGKALLPLQTMQHG